MLPLIKKINITALMFFVCLFSVFAVTIFAEKCVMTPAAKTPLQTEWPTSPLTQKTLSETTTIAQLVQYVFEWGVGLGGLAVFIALIIAGVEYITSIANANKLNDAKDRIKSALIGLVLLLSSWAIFNLINPSLNTLKDISDIGSVILDGGLASEEPCVGNWDCCKIPQCVPATDCTALAGGASDPNCCIDLNCAPENFACCQRNDSDCIRGKNVKPMRTVGGGMHSVENGVECRGDGACSENYCFCDRSTNPWKQICKANPQICISVLGEPVLGCDFIGFYDASDHQGNLTYYRVDTSDTGWIAPAANIKSYQAFKVARNRQGDYLDQDNKITTDINLAKKVNCGKNSCGCKIDVCNDPNAVKSSCVNILKFGLAFNTNVDGDHTIVEIKDDSQTYFSTIKKTVASWCPAWLCP